MNPSKPKVKPIARMLDDPHKEVAKTHGSKGLLSKLWRIILLDNKVSHYKFSMLMDHFLNDSSNQALDTPKERFNNRGNLNKEFSNAQMSWKVFCKCMKFMQFTELRLTLEAKHHDGKTTTHKVMVNLKDEVNGSSDDPLLDNEHAKVPRDQEPIVFLDDDDEEAQ